MAKMFLDSLLRFDCSEPNRFDKICFDSVGSRKHQTNSQCDLKMAFQKPNCMQLRSLMLEIFRQLSLTCRKNHLFEALKAILIIRFGAVL